MPSRISRNNYDEDQEDDDYDYNQEQQGEAAPEEDFLDFDVKEEFCLSENKDQVEETGKEGRREGEGVVKEIDWRRGRFLLKKFLFMKKNIEIDKGKK
jgi:hypothetical protein